MDPARDLIFCGHYPEVTTIWNVNWLCILVQLCSFMITVQHSAHIILSPQHVKLKLCLCWDPRTPLCKQEGCYGWLKVDVHTSHISKVWTCISSKMTGPCNTKDVLPFIFFICDLSAEHRTLKSCSRHLISLHNWSQSIHSDKQQFFCTQVIFGKKLPPQFRKCISFHSYQVEKVVCFLIFPLLFLTLRSAKHKTMSISISQYPLFNQVKIKIKISFFTVTYILPPNRQSTKQTHINVSKRSLSAYTQFRKV